MNCSICGRPLGPDGVCPNCCPTAPITLPKPRKKLTTAAWFAPVAVLVLYFGWLIESLLDLFALSKIPQYNYDPETDFIVYKNQVLYTCIRSSVALVFMALAVAVCLLLYKLATNSWGKTLREAIKPVFFAPLVFWMLTKEGGVLLTGFLYKPQNLGQISYTTYLVLSYVFYFLSALVFALFALLFVKAFLKRAEDRNNSPIQDAPAGPGPLRYLSAAWHAPVSVVVVYVAAIIEAVLYGLITVGISSSFRHDYSSIQMLNNVGSSLMMQGVVLLSFLLTVALYSAATGKWGKQRRSAYMSLAFVPIGLYSLTLPLTYFVSSLCSSLRAEGIIDLKDYTIIASVGSFGTMILLELILIGISIPIARSMLRKIEAHENTLAPKAQPAAVPAPGIGKAPAYAQPVYRPANVNAPAYQSAKPYPQAPAYGPAPVNAPAKPYPPQAPAYNPAPAQQPPAYTHAPSPAFEPAPEFSSAPVYEPIPAPDAPSPETPEA